MVDIYSKRKRSVIMSSIRSKNTVPEKEIFAYLRKHKFVFKKHYAEAPGKPDIALIEKKLAVFVDGEFWHGRHFARWSHDISAFWRSKIASNIARDKRNFAKLRRNGWKILRVWGKNLNGRKKPETLERVRKFLLLK